MRPLSSRTAGLRDRIATASASILNGLADSDLSEITAQVRSLRALVAGAGAAAGSAPDRVRAAVADFRETGKLPDSRAARLVCWGTTVTGPAQAALMEDSERFPYLLGKVDGFRSSPRPFRRCWRGLLDGYLRYDPDDGVVAGRSNWGMLREYLNDNLPLLERGDQPPEWLSIIDEHANILTQDPCGRYGAGLLEGTEDTLEPLRRELSAGDSSWFGRRVFEAQIQAAVNFNDGRFRDTLPRILHLIETHPLLADQALARVLDRYAAVIPPEVEPALRDASVSRWGNPWLGWNDKQWTLVHDNTRQMVSSWLKLRFIETFFGLLSEDKANDQRRIEFWKKQVDRISDMYFALGDAAFTDPRPDFRAMRKEMKGRLLKLENGGGAQNNAFIMQIGRHVFVEFGEKGNAMFAFDSGSLPFDLSRQYVSGNRTALKHPSHVARVIHMDSTGERWERKIEREMARLGSPAPTTRPASRTTAAVQGNATSQLRSDAPKFGMASTPPGSSPKVVSRSPAAPSPFLRSSGPAAFNAPPKSSNADPLSYLRAEGIRHHDLRDRGGALWAYAAKHGPVAAELARKGFAWAERKGAWWIKS